MPGCAGCLPLEGVPSRSSFSFTSAELPRLQAGWGGKGLALLGNSGLCSFPLKASAEAAGRQAPRQCLSGICRALELRMQSQPVANPGREPASPAKLPLFPAPHNRRKAVLSLFPWGVWSAPQAAKGGPPGSGQCLCSGWKSPVVQCLEGGEVGAALGREGRPGWQTCGWCWRPRDSRAGS